MNPIEVTDLHKHYGQKPALDGVTFTIPDGEVVGFLGPNGAGKTTTLRILLGLAQATSGTVKILGSDVSQAGNHIRQNLGYLPDVPGFPAWMHADEFLRFSGQLFGIEKPLLERRIDSLLRLAGLDGVEQKIGGYSRGMKQRLGIAQALINAPQLLLLDEPTSALDPLGRKEVLDMITALRGKATVLFSTHLLDDVERICDSAVILANGQVRTSGTITQLRTRYAAAAKVCIQLDGDPTALMRVLQKQPWCSGVEIADDGALLVSAPPSEINAQIPGLLSRSGCALRSYGAAGASLEDAFVHIVDAEDHK